MREEKKADIRLRCRPDLKAELEAMAEADDRANCLSEFLRRKLWVTVKRAHLDEET